MFNRAGMWLLPLCVMVVAGVVLYSVVTGTAQMR